MGTRNGKAAGGAVGSRGRDRHDHRRRRRTRPARAATSTGNPARGSHHGRTSTSVRIEVRNVVAYPNQYARAVATTNPKYAARARVPRPRAAPRREVTTRPMSNITIRKYVLR